MRGGVGVESLTEWYTNNNQENRKMTATGGNAAEETSKPYIIEEPTQPETTALTDSVVSYPAYQATQTTELPDIYYEPFIAVILALGVLAGILLSKTLFRRM